MLRTPRVTWLLALTLACGGRQGTATTTPNLGPASDDGARGGTKEVVLDPLRIEVARDDTGHVTLTATDALTLFELGNDALLQRRFDDAVVAYDKLAADFPGSPLVTSALYNAGVALEGKQEWALAADRYRAMLPLVARDSQDWIDGSFRLGAVLAEVGQYTSSQQVFETLLESDVLAPADRIEALARLGYALVEVKDYVGAEDVLRSALFYHREIEARQPLENNYFASMAQYQLAVIAHRQFRAVPLRYPEEQMGKDLDRKSELFLLAQDRYWKVIDDYPNAYWTTASIYQMGQMFKEFWDDFMIVPLPGGLTPGEQKEYVKLLNGDPQLRRLLQKALYFHETNVVKSHENGIDTLWVDASQERAREVKGLIGRVESGELFEPGKVPGGADPAGDEGKTPVAAPGTAPEAQSDYVPARTNL